MPHIKRIICLIRLTVPQRKYYSKADILLWATANEWQKLEIISFTDTTVEFKAYFLDKNKTAQVHYEFSTFKQENGSWFYVDGTFEDFRV